MKFIVAVLCLLLTGQASATVLEVIYPTAEERPPEDYGYQVLELALSKSGQPYHLSLSKLKMNLERARSELKAGGVSVCDFGTGKAYEEAFLPVYFPIDRGLSGYRLFIINKSLAPAFAAIRNLSDLRGKVAGQGRGWADTQILNAAGIRVHTAEFEDLFRMVDAKRFDFYPLGVEEVYPLLARYQHLAPDSIVESTLVLHYPFARLFFVRRDNTELRDAILLGLKRALADGSLQKLLSQNDLFSGSLKRADLKHRVLIEIDNPTLSAAFRAMPAEYFLTP